MNPYKDLLDRLGRLRARHRMLIHRNGGFVTISTIEWEIGAPEADLSHFCDGSPF